MKRSFLFAIMVLLFASVIRAQGKSSTFQTDRIDLCSVNFKAQKNGDRYLINLHFRVKSPENHKINAVKVTFEPSRTVVMAIYDEKCPENQRSSFLLGDKPLTTMEYSIAEEMSPSISIDYPSQIDKDNFVKIEYLLEEDGIISTSLAAAASFDNPNSINFSVTPEGEFIKFCCYCCSPPCCVYCQDPVGTCCCTCDVHVANCGIINCPPPPC